MRLNSLGQLDYNVHEWHGLTTLQELKMHYIKAAIRHIPDCQSTVAVLLLFDDWETIDSPGDIDGRQGNRSDKDIFAFTILISLRAD